MDDPALLEAERELELEAIDLGVQRYRRWRDRGELGKPEQDLAAAGVQRVEASLQAVRGEIESGKVRAGVGYSTWGPILLYVPPDMLAGAALLAVIEALVKRREKPADLQTVVRGIGAAIETMFSMLKAKEMDGELYKILTKTIKHWDGRRARRFYKKVTGLNRAFSLQERTRIGAFLLGHVMSTGWFTVEQEPGKPKVLTMDPEVSGHLASEHSNMEVLSPMRYPMVIEPADWAEGSRSPYIYHELSIYKPVNAGDKPPVLTGAPVVYAGINRIQKTKWTVNTKVFDVMDAIWKAGGGYGGLPRLNPIDVEAEVPRREGISEDALKEVKARREKLHEANAVEVGVRLEHLWRRKAVLRMARFPRFYHVWQMDWRGRIYPAASVLNPQGGDLDRGLLCFAEPVPQTPEGSRWLAIHAANCWANDGLDKEPYDARCEWVQRHLDRIRHVAADPLGDKWWLQAESPFQFLAACLELCRTDGQTSLPVAVDGTCNGLQHYALIGLDEVGGAAVNLVPCDKPRDIYSDVAVAVARLLAGRIDRPPLPRIVRKVVKRGTMTLPYGLTPIGMRDQFIEDGWMKDCPDPYASATYLRDLMYEALGQVVVKAMEYMAWLKEVAKVANEVGLPLQWTTPTGMVVTQDYVVPNEVRLRLPGLGQVLFLNPPENVRKLYRQKQLNGTCPNVIHSFDAAHLILTVNDCWEHGLRNFWLVHDSYGTYAPMVPTLGRCLRAQLIRIYKENPLEQLKRDNEHRLGHPLPDLPRRGDLDLARLEDAEYAFS